MAKRRQAYVNLDEPIFDAFEKAARTAYPDRTLADSLREAALLFVGSDPLDAVKMAARRAAWLEAKIQIATIIGTAMKKAGEIFAMDVEAARNELAAMEASGSIPPRDG